MSGEFISSSSPEEERLPCLSRVLDAYFPEDKEFVADMDEEDKINFVYGQLLEAGEDPEAILEEFGVTERSDYDI